jgi:CheY-like chemotaxis protein
VYEQSLISIVDDDQSFRESLGRLLKSHGYAVGLFPSGVAFLESAELVASPQTAPTGVESPGKSALKCASLRGKPGKFRSQARERKVYEGTQLGHGCASIGHDEVHR